MEKNIALAKINELYKSYKRCSKDASKQERINDIKALLPYVSTSDLPSEIAVILGTNLQSKVNVPKVDVKDILPKLGVFKTIELMTEVVYQANSNGLLLIGMGGVGKTETVLRKVKDLVSRATNTTETIRLTSSITPAALYEFLFVNRYKLIIIDDCDDVLKEAKSISLLKNAMDTSVNRYVQWNAKGRNYYPKGELTEHEMDELYENTKSSGIPSLPTEFEFFGQIIVISNIKLEKFKDKALLTRVSTINVNLNRTQLKDRLIEISSSFDTTVSPTELDNVLEYMFHVVDNYEVKQEVNIRTFKHSLGVYETHNGKKETIDNVEYDIWKLLINSVLTTEDIE